MPPGIRWLFLESLWDRRWNRAHMWKELPESPLIGGNRAGLGVQHAHAVPPTLPPAQGLCELFPATAPSVGRHGQGGAGWKLPWEQGGPEGGPSWDWAVLSPASSTCEELPWPLRCQVLSRVLGRPEPRWRR